MFLLEKYTIILEEWLSFLLAWKPSVMKISIAKICEPKTSHSKVEIFNHYSTHSYAFIHWKCRIWFILAWTALKFSHQMVKMESLVVRLCCKGSVSLCFGGTPSFSIASSKIYPPLNWCISNAQSCSYAYQTFWENIYCFFFRVWSSNLTLHFLYFLIYV